MKRTFSLAWTGVRALSRGIGIGARAFVVLVGIAGVTIASADYLMTIPGSGTTFASVVISTKHYAAMVLCDAGIGETQCATVTAAGAQKVDGSAVTQPVSGAVTANAGTNLNTSALATSATQGTTADAPATVPTTTTAATEIALLKAIANTAALPGTLSSQYPSGAVPLTASATGTTAATTATLAASTLIKTYICGYSIRANATANTNVTDTITGVISGTMSSALWVPANTAGLGVDEQIFTPCIPASATNTGIAAVSGAPGAGGAVTVKAWGYQL